MELSEYQTLKDNYWKSHPYTGDVSTYYGPEAFVGGWGNEADMSASNLPQEQWTQDTYQNWLGTLTPEQQAEYESLVQQRHAKTSKMQQMAFLGAAGAMAAPGLVGAMGAESGAGAGLGGLDAESVYGAGSGWGADTLSAMGMGGSGGTSAAGSAGSLWNSVPDYLKYLGGNAIKNTGGNLLSQLIAGGTNAYMGNKQAGNYQSVIDEINRLYSPDSAYAKQMKQALDRKDAAAGRNSQYGSREVELAAALTNSKAQALTSSGYGNLLGQRGINQNVPWNGFLSVLGSGAGQDLITKAGGGFGSWLSGLFGNSGDKYSPTAPNTSGYSNWWNQIYADGGP
jgi:hypothetical protein